MDYIKDVSRILLVAIHLLSESGAQFLSSIGLAVLVSLIFMAVAMNYYKLWNIKFHLSILHKSLCIFAAFATFVFFILYPCLRFTKPAADLMISDWKLKVVNDTRLTSLAFNDSYRAVKKLGIENFESIPDGHTVPATRYESQQTVAKTFSRVFLKQFQSVHPLLSKIVWFGSSVSSDINNEITSRIVHYFQTTSNTMPLNTAADITADTLKDHFGRNSSRLIPVAKLIFIAAFLLIQAFVFGVIGWDAWRDVRVTT